MFLSFTNLSNSGVQKVYACIMSKRQTNTNSSQTEGPQKKKEKLQCEICRKTFTEQKTLKRHKKNDHDSKPKDEKATCYICNQTFSRKDSLKRHVQKKHPNTQQTALDGSVVVNKYELKEENKMDAALALEYFKDKLVEYIQSFIKNQGTLKAYVALQIKFTKDVKDGVVESQPFFRSSNFVVLKKGDEIKKSGLVVLEKEVSILNQKLGNAFLKILDSIAKYQREGSNWTLKEVSEVQIHIVHYKPLFGSSYIKTPAQLRKGAIINVKNNDNECFKWSILAALHNREKDGQRVSYYRNSHFPLNFEGLTFPIKIEDVQTFENQNDYSINVLSYDKNFNFKPLHITEKRQAQKHINLLLITEGDKGHYCWIKKWSRLMGNQKKDRNSHNYCHFCFYHSKDEGRVKEHIQTCRTYNGQIFKLPELDKNLLSYRTKGMDKRLKVPVVIYADFECILSPVENDPKKKQSQTLNVHKPSGYAYKVVGITEKLTKRFKCYTGADAAKKFIYAMKKEEKWFRTISSSPKEMIWTSEDEIQFEKATVCFLCKKAFQKTGCKKKVRDHCHITGAFRGAAHSDCNINYRKRRNFLPVVFHNLRRYDSHIIMQASHVWEKVRIECIPLSIEQFMSFRLNTLRFIDSNLFLSASLEKLVQNLADAQVDSTEKFKHTLELTGKDADLLKLLQRKQVYPYEYFTKFEVFKDESLPNKTCFYNSLKNVHISKEDYAQVEEVWKAFNFKTLKDYHNLYVKTDVAHLADVFEHFRKTSLQQYSLDPAHFYSTPGLAWQAALMKSDVELELLTDADMFEMIESGKRGGVAMITKRYSEANNSTMSEASIPTMSEETYSEANNATISEESNPTKSEATYSEANNAKMSEETYSEANHPTMSEASNPAMSEETYSEANNPTMSEASNPTMSEATYSEANNLTISENTNKFDKTKRKWIIYLDANNLYGWAMSQPLPLKDFKWLTEEDISSLDIKNISDDAETGYILEVDLEYPEELHDQHNDFPLAPEKINLTKEMLSPYCKTLLDKFHIKEPGGDKLIPNLMNKEKYVVHYRTLKLYLKLGMNLTKVHRVISFHQTAWLKPYIDFNTEKRKQSSDVSQKDFFKLMNNSVYGKTLENVRKYKNVKLVTDKEKLKKLTCKPLYECFRIINKDLVALELRQRTVKLDKPIHVGVTVLDLAKAFIYKFHYCHIQQKYGGKAKLLFTDTDSLCYEIETEDIYSDMQKDGDLYDFSNYPKDHPLYDEHNKNVVGKMKDETQGVPVDAFVALRPKMYCLKYGDSEKKAAQGVSKEIQQQKLRFDDYKGCLFNQVQQQAVTTSIQSKQHKLSTVAKVRVTLSPYDDKRFILPGGIESRAYGHKLNKNSHETDSA
ncbi:hypothetical protein Bpfe_014492 [Biomphalaria pfeifferi]|uniref:C2H2-type domain-containing protein n=1 Tax=Biomphalaria pfeifferi TaxID=112525 RepID=A0AAD8FA90_BIOPF|nr:hypothetical protein Bpfe_014492 [Biomphalaria pfeifferi]